MRKDPVLLFWLLVGIGWASFAQGAPRRPTPTPKFELPPELEMTTRYVGDQKTFVTTGQLDVKDHSAKLVEVVGNLSSYNEWALHQINVRPGGDTFVVHIQDLVHQPQKGRFVALYDLDLTWPFNLEGQRLELVPAEEESSLDQPDEAALCRQKLKLGEPTFTLQSFDVHLRCLKKASEAAVLEFSFRVKLSALLNVFFTESLYRGNVEARLVRVMLNLKRKLDFE